MKQASLWGLAVALALAAPAAARADDGDGADRTAFGLGLKVRQQRVSRRMLGLFFEDTPAGATQRGFGLEFTRRKGELEIALGLGYDRLDATDGYYLEKGADPTVPGKVDLVEFHKLQWFTAEVSAVGHLPLHKLLALRYGVGFGVAMMRGEILQTDALCTGTDLPRDCAVDPAAVDVDAPADIPPVLPVVNALLGLQLRPFDVLTISLDAGLHTVPYAAVTATLYLW